MRKIGILTFHGVLNHGAVLQAYALNKFLNENGADCELINYSPWYFTWQIYRPAKGFSKSILKYKRLLKFKRFEKNHLNISRASYRDLKSLSNIKYGALVCGSDQVWNKDITKGEIDKAYLLDFPFCGKRFSYAASSGANRIAQESVVAVLSRFDGLGVREVGLFEELLAAGLNARHVADPTFLIEPNEYKEIIYSKILPKKPYIVSYEVSTDETRKKYSEAIIKLKKKFSLPVVHIGDKVLDCADVNLLNISTNDWIALISSSNMVVTNSFHGCSFGIKFKKPLVVLSHLDNDRNARPLSLLGSLGMTDCFYNVSNNEVDEIPVDYMTIDRNYDKYEKFVNKSKEYALEMIREASEN